MTGEKKLDSFFENQQQVHELQQKRREGMTEDEIKEKISEVKKELNDKWGVVDMLDIDKLDVDGEGIPYIILRVDEHVIEWINDIQAMLNLPKEQCIYSSLAMYHSLLAYTLFMVTGDPLYQRSKQHLREDQQKALEFVQKEVMAVKARLTLIDDLTNDLKSKEIKDEQPVGSTEEPKPEEQGTPEEKKQGPGW